MKPLFGKVKKAQAGLVHIAYSVYCFAHKQGRTNVRLWTYAEFTRWIKEAHQEGAKLWDSNKKRD